MRPGGDQWIPGVIVHQSGPVTYYILMWERETFENAIKTIYIKLSDLADPEPDVSSPEAENDLDATITTSLSDNGASVPSAVLVPVSPSTERNLHLMKVKVVDTFLRKDIRFILSKTLVF